MAQAHPCNVRLQTNKQNPCFQSQEKESGPSLLGRNGHEQTTRSIGNGELAEESDQSSTMLVVDMKKQPGRAKRKEVGMEWRFGSSWEEEGQGEEEEEKEEDEDEEDEDEG